MKRAILQREPDHPDGTFGKMWVEEKTPEVVTVEQLKDGEHPRVPAGVYPLTLGMYYGGDGVGGAHKDYPAYIITVPARKDVKIHRANLARQLLGCIAPGQEFGTFNGVRGVQHSEAALAIFMEAMGGEDGEIEIRDAPPS